MAEEREALGPRIDAMDAEAAPVPAAASDPDDGELRNALLDIAHAFGATISTTGETRDMIDELMDIEKGLQTVSNPFGGITSALFDDPSTRKVWNPGDYKDRPRANSLRCVYSSPESTSSCTACMDVCPVDAIRAGGRTVKISDDCMKCGLCLSVCPTEVFADPLHLTKKLYDQIARAAAIHEQCYITCTRALGRLPEANEIVLPCVGALAPEVLLAVLVDYPNVNIYLPEGICDRCRTTTGEDVLMENVSKAEEWSRRAVGLAFEEGELNHARKRSYERAEFMRRYLNMGVTAMVGMANPVIGGLQAVTKRIKDHAARINALERQLDEMVGSTTFQKKRRTLIPRRQMVLGAIQRRPWIIDTMELSVPSCDPAFCTMCGACARVCPTNACDLDADGHFSVAASYCVGCGACMESCPEVAITMVPANLEELVIPDEGDMTTSERNKHLDNVLESLKAEALGGLENLMGAATGADGASGSELPAEEEEV